MSKNRKKNLQNSYNFLGVGSILSESVAWGKQTIF